eukprot:782341-Pelagomonas_calceolata.AAC.2
MAPSAWSARSHVRVDEAAKGRGQARLKAEYRCLDFQALWGVECGCCPVSEGIRYAKLIYKLQATIQEGISNNHGRNWCRNRWQ